MLELYFHSLLFSNDFSLNDIFLIILNNLNSNIFYFCLHSIFFYLNEIFRKSLQLLYLMNFFWLHETFNKLLELLLSNCTFGDSQCVLKCMILYFFKVVICIAPIIMFSSKPFFFIS